MVWHGTGRIQPLMVIPVWRSKVLRTNCSEHSGESTDHQGGKRDLAQDYSVLTERS